MHFIKGEYRWTFRSLLTKNLKLAKEEYHRRKVSRAAGPGNSPRIRISDAAEVIVGVVIQRYVEDGCPDRFRKERPIKTKQTEQHNCETLLEYWDRIPFSGLTLAACDRYHDWRCDRITRGTGDRTVDLELNTLSNALLWGCRKEIIPHNPLAVRRPRYCSDKNVHHCREFMPASVEELHFLAAIFMEQPQSVVLGFQALVEGFTGLRTVEALKLRTDAKPNEPGWVTPDGKSLCVWRVKGQEAANPFVAMNEGLKQTLAALRRWKAKHHPKSPYYFPSPCLPGRTVHKNTLTKALFRIRPRLPRKITSHGFRAFFVTVRRSHGILDSQIAIEVGHTSGGATLVEVYGGTPPHWLSGDGPKMSWLTKKSLAWSVLWPQPAKRPQKPQPTRRKTKRASAASSKTATIFTKP